MKNKFLIVIVLCVVFLSVVFLLFSLNNLMQELDGIVVTIPIQEDSVGGADEEQSPSEEEPTVPDISVTEEFSLLEPRFECVTLKDGSKSGAIAFRAAVSFDFKQQMQAEGGSFYMLISPLDIVTEVIASAGTAESIDWLTVFENKADEDPDNVIFLKLEDTYIEFIQATNCFVMQGKMGNILYKNHNRVMVGIPMVELPNGSRQYASTGDESYKSMARSYAYLCSWVYTDMVVNETGYAEGVQELVVSALNKSVNLASGISETDLDATLQYVLTFDDDKSEMTVDVGTVLSDLIPKFSPDVALYYKWRSTNSDVVTIEDGQAVACGVGNAEVTVHMGDLTARCVISVIDDDCETVTCEICQHVYWSGDVNACPVCGAHIESYSAACECCNESMSWQVLVDSNGNLAPNDYIVECSLCSCEYTVVNAEVLRKTSTVCNGWDVTKYLFCHCERSIPYSIRKYGDGSYTCLNETLSCECKCEYMYNETFNLYETIYDCIEDATHTETKSAWCECDGATITWEIECDVDGNRCDNMEIHVSCPNCGCDYTVSGDGLTLVKDNEATCGDAVIFCAACNSNQIGVVNIGEDDEATGCLDCGAYLRKRTTTCSDSNCEENISYEFWLDKNGKCITDNFSFNCEYCGCGYTFYNAGPAIGLTDKCSNYA